MRVLVTRPEPEAERTAAALRSHGCDVMLAPLLRIDSVDFDLERGPWDAVAMTSVNAARAIAGDDRARTLSKLPVYAVGNRTAAAVRAAGFERVVSADGDAADLVQLIGTHHGAGTRLLYLAGENRSGDLAASLAGAGIAVRTLVVYRAVALSQLPAEVRDALSAGGLDGVLHFSRRSAEGYVRCAMPILARALAPLQFCLSPQVAEPLAAAGAASIRVARHPRESDLIELVVA